MKQSYTMTMVAEATAAPPRLREAKFYGTVEPLPQLFLRLARLTEQTRVLLAYLHVMPVEVEQSLKQAENLFARVIAIVEKELTEKELSAAEVDFINTIGQTFENIIANLTRAITPPRPVDVPEGAEVSGSTVGGQEEAFKTTLVADVHTDLNTKRVLEEGVCPVQWMLVVNRTADGALSVSLGPVFSYYEFTHTVSDRLTNEAWRTMVREGQVPEPRWWTQRRPVASGAELFCTPQTPGCEQ